MLFSEIAKKTLFSSKIAIFAFFREFKIFMESLLSWSSKCLDFYFFFNFWRLESLMKIKSKNIQLSLFLSFFRIGFIFSKLTEFLITWLEPITWRVLESPAEIILVRVTRDQNENIKFSIWHWSWSWPREQTQSLNVRR